ncbi:Flp pilus assembly protein CpaB [Nocardioides sp. SR21]|uniref:Flp pilus assembly protein CpaB n=1 Tax=Nocardioides sp. SR21 TaxID=2919501 RepID=UPI001FAB21C2|nr:Flp pilus assembly protein CpaB [Nocardioides sp. SR21]
MARRSLLLLVAIVTAALGATMLVVYVQGADARAADGQERVTVLVATESVEPGETVQHAIDAGKFDEREVAQDDLSAQALTSTDGLDGLVAIGRIYPGQQLIAAQFGDPGSEEVLGIPDELMAISVELTDPERVAGFVQPGSWVAIFMSGDPELYLKDGTTRKLAPLTRLMLPKVQVLGVGTTSVTSRTTTEDDGTETTQEVPRTILTIAVNQAQAEEVIYASRNGDLTFALRTDKTRVVDRPGVTAGDIAPEILRGVS